MGPQYPIVGRSDSPDDSPAASPAAAWAALLVAACGSDGGSGPLHLAERTRSIANLRVSYTPASPSPRHADSGDTSSSTSPIRRRLGGRPVRVRERRSARACPSRRPGSRPMLRAAPRSAAFIETLPERHGADRPAPRRPGRPRVERRLRSREPWKGRAREADAEQDAGRRRAAETLPPASGRRQAEHREHREHASTSIVALIGPVTNTIGSPREMLQRPAQVLFHHRARG